jgi:phospholipid/cholesterol/gamma-HCH transport system substrate-binding protein
VPIQEKLEKIMGNADVLITGPNVLDKKAQEDLEKA